MKKFVIGLLAALGLAMAIAIPVSGTTSGAEEIITVTTEGNGGNEWG